MASKRTARNKKRLNKSVRRSTKCSKPAVVQMCFEMLHAIKLFHWNTHSYAQHKATDELHEKMSANVDKFVEIMLGKDPERLRRLDRKIRLINSRNTRDFKERIYEYREYFISMTKCLDSRMDSDLLSLRDDILADLNQFLYLLTLHG